MSGHQDECSLYFGGRCDCEWSIQNPSPQPEMPEGWEWNSDPEFPCFIRKFSQKTGFCVPISTLRQLLATQGLSVVRSVCVQPEGGERFGQCAPADAHWSERVEVAAALLLLAGPADLLAALRDAGLHVIDAEPKTQLLSQGEHSPTSDTQRTTTP